MSATIRTIRREPLPGLEILTEGLVFPEGPVALADGSVVVVEINAGRLTRVSAAGDIDVIADLGGGPNGAARGPDEAIWVANNGGWLGESRRPPSIQRVDLASGRFEDVWRDCAGTPLAGPNDLVFDADGGVWFTDLPAGRVCYGPPDGGPLREVITGLASPNGIGLSPDGATVYVAETVHGELAAPDPAAPAHGVITRRRILGPGEVAPSREAGAGSGWDRLSLALPGVSLDSLAVQADGAVCIAGLPDPGVVVLDPATGDAVMLELGPEWNERFVTNLCFGGPGQRTAYLTLSERGILARGEWPSEGLPLNFQEIA